MRSRSRGMAILLCAGTLTVVSSSGQAKLPLEPVIVVAERAEIERGLQHFGVPFETTFVAALDDARRARGDLARFIRADLKTADRIRKAKLRRVLQAERAHVWHCGGFERGDSRYLLCSFVRHRDGDAQLSRPRFPETSGGVTDVGRCIFSLEAGRIVTLGWSTEA